MRPHQGLLMVSNRGNLFLLLMTLPLVQSEYNEAGIQQSSSPEIFISQNTGHNLPHTDVTDSEVVTAAWTTAWDNATIGNMSEDTTKPPRKELCVGSSQLTLRHAKLKLICMPFLVVVGITGNMLSFVVMGSAVYRRKSYSYYLRALAIFDSLTLITKAVMMGNEISVTMGAGRILDGHTLLTCKLTNFMESVVFLMSSWLVVAFTFDRYIAVCHPLQRARLCTDMRAKVTIAILFVLIMASQTFRFYYIDKLNRDQPCHAASELRMEYFGIHYVWFSFTLRFALPFFVIVICNGLIIFHVQRMQKIRQTEERDKKRRAHLAITTLVAICGVFILTLVPNAIIALVQYLRGRDIATYCVLIVIDTPFQMIRLLNYSTNFIMYGLTGRLFRCELRRLFNCRRHLNSSPSVSKKVIKVNFQTLQRGPPALVGINGAPCRRVVDHDSQERRLFLGRNDREFESEV